MSEPNFSESQLQQAANSAFIRYIFEQHGTWAFAHVPSLMAEFNLGWDTAFYLHWLPHVPLAADEGCNFFLQYKLSSELTSPGAKESSHWGAHYFRFKIPHCTRDASGQLVDDYHQWERLKNLSDKNYPTFYATNSTLRKSDIHSALEAGTLFNFVPLLDVRDISAMHKHVTFTSSSNFFHLHSDKERAAKARFVETLNLLGKSKQSTLEASVNELVHVLQGIAGKSGDWSRDLARISAMPFQRIPPEIHASVRYVFLASFVSKHLGAQLVWLPKWR